MIDVVLVTSPVCHLCEDAKEGLAELARTFPLSVTEVDLASPQGQAVFERFRPPMPPFVVIDGALFSFGRLPRKKLRRFLERAA
jgi:hypothetical protein